MIATRAPRGALVVSAARSTNDQPADIRPEHRAALDRQAVGRDRAGGDLDEVGAGPKGVPRLPAIQAVPEGGRHRFSQPDVLGRKGAAALPGGPGGYEDVPGGQVAQSEHGDNVSAMRGNRA